jgi:hypothetical protein
MATNPETKLWHHVRDRLRKRCEARGIWLYLTRVENAISTGHPDVEYCIEGAAGVIELKQIPAWPKRSETKVRVKHYTQAQRDDLKERHVAGGRAFVLLRVGEPGDLTTEYLLLRTPWCLLLGGVDAKTLRGISERVWRGVVNADELIEELGK